ncbi:MAG TPA: alpha-amylase family glycosyl hydrolase [Bacteroidota bacterium]|nr:alpha-amylase family glycosyl hydrolase [Bacteroidota bacterium]
MIDLDALFSSKGLGCIVGNRSTTFRVFAPRASEVRVAIFDRHDEAIGDEFTMTRDEQGVWEFAISKELYGKYYAYRVSGPSGKGENFNPDILLADPYSRAVVTKNNYHQPAKSIILKTNYEWEGDTFVVPKNHNELIIYEAQVRDLTAHDTSGVNAKGTYAGITENGKRGGLSYLKDLGINTIEFLPLFKFGTIELPYRSKSVLSEGFEFNTWNPYERNHWGYMTSYFFTPETYYGSDGTMQPNKYNGVDGRAVREFKDLVKVLHREKMAVILDVVFNHVSYYDYSPFRYIDKFYYFHTDSDGRFTNRSGCNNDFKTDRPMVRRFIIDCLKYWMTEYHIDGFRFDLATMIDNETLRQMTLEVKAINPNAVLIAEPWSNAGYNPSGFSDLGWSSWNDRYRNAVKGEDPIDRRGYIFGNHQGHDHKKTFMSFITGTLREDGGLFERQEHSISYVESHDGYTLGDFIRLALGDAQANQKITNLDEHVKLTPRQLTVNKFAALVLLTTQGPIMLHEGQEFAHSKVIVPTLVSDSHVGMIDHNSYDKDNETNYLNYDHQKINLELYNYYKGLIALRKLYPIISSGTKNAVEFFETSNDFVIAFQLNKDKAPSPFNTNTLFIILNANFTHETEINLPEGNWKVLANAEEVVVDDTGKIVKEKIIVPPTSGMILLKQ